MKHSLKSILAVAMLLTMTLVFTSCEGALDDIFGEWDKPSGGANAGATSADVVTYLKWDDATKALKATPLPGSYKTMTATETTWSGTYVVDQDVEIADDVTLGGDVDLIILDGKTLSLATNKKIEYLEETYTLSIFGQSEGSDAGKLQVSVLGYSTSSTYGTLNIHSGIVNATATEGETAIHVGRLNIYGGTVVAEGENKGFEIVGDLKIYGGDVKATTTVTNGIDCDGDIEITGGKVYAKGGDATSTKPGGQGIVFDPGYKLTIDGTADVTAIGGAGYNDGGTWTNGGVGIYGSSTTTIDIKGGELKVSGGYGRDAIYLSDGSVMTISGSSTKVTATGGSNGTGINTCGNLTIYDGLVKVYGGGKDASSGYAFGFSGIMTIKGGNVTVEGGDAVSSNVNGGVAIGGELNVYGGTLKATGGNGDGTGKGGHGMAARLFISGGSVEVTGGNGGSTGRGGSGIATGDPVVVVYTGGSFIAMGGTGSQEGKGLYDSVGSTGGKIRNDKNTAITYYTYDGTSWGTTGTSIDAASSIPGTKSGEITNRGVKIE